MKKDQPVRIRGVDAQSIQPWLPPDVGAEAPVVQALARKPSAPLEDVDVSVVEEEIFAEKLTLSQWEEICEEARREGHAEGLAEGREQGRQQGYQEGLQQGLEAGQAQINERLKVLDALIEQLQKPLEQERASLEEALVNLVIHLAEATVKAELSQNIDVLMRSVQDALDQLPEGEGRVLLRVAPEQVAPLEPLLEELALQVKPDPELTAGSCIVDSGNCRVDYQVEQRFVQVADQLRARLIKPTDPPAE
ncbi:hypothetical protein H9C73_07225 [Marinobacterium sp. AK62]|uniref:Flagellar assembly protein FliH n=1 Tax=Marinobacterium alkalitolerans TaxID=1542925 RepID=A0ABS3ZBW9_9GAMM|nr:FliH/SctL family protein [Marinobacterium alkalitolerans]MBP0048524.1 hypothetical protein [Marinobacterium alkalitolerans]